MIGQPEPIILTGDAAARFANSLFRPTREESERRNAVMEKIDREVIITEHDDGFSAEVSWLDLSFLDDDKPSHSFIELGMTIKSDTARPFSPVVEAIKSIFSIPSEMESRCEETSDRGDLPCAA